MSSVETGQMSAVETGQMSAVPESSGSAWACGACSGAPRRGLTRGEESEEGGGACTIGIALGRAPPPFLDVFGVSKNRSKNGIPHGVHLGIEFSMITVDFWNQVGRETQSNID